MATDSPKFSLSTLSTREIVIIVGTLFAAICYGFYMFEYSVQAKKMTRLDRQLQEKQASIEIFQKALIDSSHIDKAKVEIDKIKGEIIVLQETLERGKSRLAGQDMEILNEIQSEADFYGVFLKSMKTSERNIARVGLRLREVSLILEMECDYDALKNFVGSLKDLPAIITIQSLETTRVEKILPKIESRLHLNVIVL